MKTRLSTPVRTLIAGVVAVGAAALAVRLPELSGWKSADVVALLALVAATFAAEQFSLRVRFGGETKNISLTEASFAAALLVGVRPSVLTMAAGLGVIVAYAVRRTAGYKIAFNAGSYVASVTAAELVFVAAHPAGSIVAIALAMAAFFAVNAGTVVGIIALVEGRSFWSVFRPITQVELSHAAGNTGAGFLAANVWTASAAVAPAVILIAAVCYLAYRAMLPTAVDIRRALKAQ